MAHFCCRFPSAERLARPARHPAPTFRLQAPPTIDDTEPSSGPGWFESSWDLRHGLEVVESDTMPAEFALWMLAAQAPIARLAA